MIAGATEATRGLGGWGCAEATGSKRSTPSTWQLSKEIGHEPSSPAAKIVTGPQGAIEKGERSPQNTIYQHPNDSARMCGVTVAYIRNVGMTNLSQYAIGAIMEKVERLEAVRACRPGLAHGSRPMGE